MTFSSTKTNTSLLPPAVLSVQSLELRRGKKVLADRLSFELSGSGLYFLTGPNGAGKSTLLLTVAGLIAPQNGEILLNGQPLYGRGKMPLKARALEIVYLPQNSECPDDFEVLELVALGRLPYHGLLSPLGKLDYELSRKALADLGFRPSVKQHMGNLSGGERQLAWFAQGLVQNGSLWLLDEPTQHLDAARREHLFNILIKLATEYGKTLLVATHELEALAKVPNAYHLDMLAYEKGFVPCTQQSVAEALEAHKAASGLF